MCSVPSSLEFLEVSAKLPGAGLIIKKNEYCIWKGWRDNLFFISLLVLFVVSFYRGALGAYFNSLDMIELQRTLDNAHKLYLHHEEFRPMFYALNHLMYTFFGLAPLPYHVVNLVFYLCLLILLYHFYNILIDNRNLSMTATFLFASFYLHAEVVSEIVKLYNILSALFVLATIVSFYHYRRTRVVKYYVLAIFLAFLANFSKEASVCLPLLLLFFDYYISYGTFPPKSALKDIRQNLFSHLPFWFIALTIFVITFALPRDAYFQYLIKINTLSTLLNHAFFLVAYSLAPCFVTDKLTILLAFSVTIGIGWLFYHSDPHKRALLLVLLACTGFSLLPYIIVGPIPRYFFLPSVFSMLLVTLLAFKTASFGYELLKERLPTNFFAETAVTMLAILVLSPTFYFNYQHVSLYNRNLVDAGRLLKEIVEGTLRLVPDGPAPGESKVICINLPSTVKSKAVLSSDLFVAYSHFHFEALDLHYRQRDILLTRSELNKMQAYYVDLGYDKVRLSPESWWGVLKQYNHVQTLSAEEFDALSMDKGNRVLFLNPVTSKMEDVSGWTHKQLVESITPYTNKLISRCLIF